MNMFTYDTVTEALNDLNQRGYIEDFNLRPHCIECRSHSLHLYPEDFIADECYRFEGDSNPDDNTIVFAISSKNNIKGTLVDAYGAYSDRLTDDMIRQLRMVMP